MSDRKSKYKLGTSVTLEKTFNAQDVEIFAELTGDKNPVHLDEQYAAGTRFGKRIVHGMLISSLFSTVFGTIFPGEGSIYMGQSLKFLKPVYLGEKITAKVTLTAIRDDKPIGSFETICLDEAGDVVVTGEATLLLP